MRNITKIFTLVLSLILLFAVSCSNDDKTGVANNPPENDTEITGGGTETGGSGTETGGSGTETGGGSGTGTGGDSGSGTGTGGETGGSGSGSGSGEGGSDEVTPPSETETIEEIDAKDFPADLLGRYAHSKIIDYNITVSYNEDKGQTRILAKLIPEVPPKDGSDGITPHTIWIEKWTKTTKGGKIIKLENKSNREDYIITFDYEAKTISGEYIINNNEKYSSFSGTKK